MVSHDAVQRVGWTATLLTPEQIQNERSFEVVDVLIPCKITFILWRLRLPAFPHLWNSVASS